MWLADGDSLMCYIVMMFSRLLRYSYHFLCADIGLLRILEISCYTRCYLHLTYYLSLQDSGLEAAVRRHTSLSSTDSFDSEQSPLPRGSIASSEGDSSAEQLARPRQWSVTSLDSLESTSDSSLGQRRAMWSTTSGESSGSRSWSATSMDLEATFLAPLTHDQRSMSVASLESAETDVTHLSAATSQGSTSPDMKTKLSLEKCTTASDRSSVSDKTLGGNSPPRDDSTPNSKSSSGSSQSQAETLVAQ